MVIGISSIQLKKAAVDEGKGEGTGNREIQRVAGVRKVRWKIDSIALRYPSADFSFRYTHARLSGGALFARSRNAEASFDYRLRRKLIVFSCKVSFKTRITNGTLINRDGIHTSTEEVFDVTVRSDGSGMDTSHDRIMKINGKSRTNIADCMQANGSPYVLNGCI